MRFRSMCGFALAACTACGGDDTADDDAADTIAADDSGSGSGSGADSGSGSGSADSTGVEGGIVLSGTFVDFIMPTPIPGGTVCFHPAGEPCTETDEVGQYTLPGVPPGVEGALRFEHEDYFPYLVWIVTPEEDQIVNGGPLDLNTAALFAIAIGGEGSTTDPTKGQISLEARDPRGTGMAGVTFEMEPASGMIGYINAQGVPSTTQTETTSSGVAGALNVDPGDILVTATHESLTCTAAPLALVSADGRLIRRAEAGFLSSGPSIVCVP